MSTAIQSRPQSIVSMEKVVLNILSGGRSWGILKVPIFSKWMGTIMNTMSMVMSAETSTSAHISHVLH
jgi:hypothetical protein